MNEPKPTLLLADDHQIFLDGLRTLLQPRFEIVGEVNDGRALLELAREKAADVTISDLSMPGISGLDLLDHFRHEGVDSKVIILTMHDEPEYAAEAIDKGASGYALKNSTSSELLHAVEEVLSGSIYLPQHFIRDVLDITTHRNGQAGHPSREERLSERHREILQLLAEGLLAKQIGDKLGISSRTVEYHKYKLMEKLGFKTTAELIRFAVQAGIADEPKAVCH